MSTMFQYEQISPLNKIIVALAAMGGTYYWYWQELIIPKMEMIQTKREELNQLKGEQKQLAQSLINPISLEEEISQANREFKKLVELLPDEPATEKILNDFASLSRITGVEMREFMPTPQKPSADTASVSRNTPEQTKSTNLQVEGTSSLAIGVKLNGSFSSVVSFLDMAMSLPRVIRIEDFEMSNPEKKLNLSQRPKLAFVGQFSAFFQTSKSEGAGQPQTPAKAPERGGPKTSDIGKPLIDINEFVDKSFSAKGKAGGPE